MANWDQQQRVLALHLEAESWDLVSQSALGLRGLTAGMQRTLGPGGPHEGEKVLPLGPTQLAGLRTMWDTASKAHRALAELAGAKPEPGLLHQGE